MGPKVDKRAWKVDKSEGFEAVCQPGRNQTATFVNQAQPVLDCSTGSGELTEDVVDGADFDHLPGQGADRNAAKERCDHQKLQRHAPREGHAFDIGDR